MWLEQMNIHLTHENSLSGRKIITVSISALGILFFNNHIMLLSGWALRHTFLTNSGSVHIAGIAFERSAP